MKSKICPYRRHCHDVFNCETCDFGKAFEKLSEKIKRLKKKNEALRAENEALLAVNVELNSKIEILKNPNF